MNCRSVCFLWLASLLALPGLAADKDRDHATKIRELYLLAFARPPLDDETAIAIAHIEKCGDDVKRAYEDIVWALINTKEFLFNH